MRKFPICSNIAAACLSLLVIATNLSHAADGNSKGSKGEVTYEAYGAVGDGKTDDLPAICKAHAYANEHGLPVRSNPKATYHLGAKALTAIIQTDTDWGTSKFIIDDSKDVENNRKSIFEVSSPLKPISLKIEKLKRGQDRLDIRPESDCLVHVENKDKKLFIRLGKNQNNGSNQSEVFILRKNGTIEGIIDWNYDTVSKVTAQPIDPENLTVRGGLFTLIANQGKADQDPHYWARNIQINRSNTVIDGVTYRITGEGKDGHPYSGFLNASKCANVTFSNCSVDGHKVYIKIGNAKKPVPMGTYGYQATHVVNLRMSHCTQGNDIMDRSRWGVVASNFMKNFLVEDCVLSRVDVHQGISGNYIIRRTTLGHAGLNAIGRGQLIVEDSTLNGGNLIQFRGDYGSTWDGDVSIKNSRWIPGNHSDKSPLIFGTENNGQHDFGYPCSMPSHVKIDGLVIDDAKAPKDYKGARFFNNAIDASSKDRPSPYRLPESLDVKNLKTTSGIPPRVSDSPEMTKAIKVTGL